MEFNRKLLWKVSLVLIAALLLFPWKSTVAPAVRIQVLDVDGSPAKNVIVKQEWGHFNFGSDGKEYSRTDENGYVAFPERHVRAYLLSRLFLPVLGIFTHAGIGPHGSIRAHGEDSYVWTSQNHSIIHPAPEQIRLKRWDVHTYP